MDFPSILRSLSRDRELSVLVLQRQTGLVGKHKRVASGVHRLPMPSAEIGPHATQHLQPMEMAAAEEQRHLLDQSAQNFPPSPRTDPEPLYPHHPCPRLPASLAWEGIPWPSHAGRGYYRSPLAWHR